MGFLHSIVTSFKRKPIAWKAALLFVISVLSFILLAKCSTFSSSCSKPEHFEKMSTGQGKYVETFDKEYFIDNSTKKILLWTTFFNSVQWQHDFRKSVAVCPHKCDISTNKNEIESAEAVMFHFLDAYMWLKTPTFRDPKQVWVLCNMESPIFMHYFGLNKLTSSKYMFNWTMSYRTDSTIFSPSGVITNLTEEEQYVKTEVYKSRDLFREKYKMAYGLVGDCYDDSGRLSLLHELQHHISLDFYGDCGNLTCPIKNREICIAKLKPYKFRASFENGNCRDYVTEKFWDALTSETIPIVNWKNNQTIKYAPPNSYINVYDFKNIGELSSYLKKVSENRTLFNSYHQWRTKYKVRIDYWTGVCNLCTKLYEPKRKAQTITDPIAWIEDDTCRRWSISNTIRRHFNYWTFRLGWRYGIHGNKI